MITNTTSRKTFSFCLLTFAFTCLWAQQAPAQIGNCKPAVAEAFLDAGNVRARILNNGALFWRGSPNVYEAPKEGGTNAIFNASLLIGGLIDNQVRAAASRIGPWEFWAGPLDNAGLPPSDCTSYDKIWEITEQDIAAFLKDNTVSHNLSNWPWQLGAPVVDGDGIPNNYDLKGGDLPELLGHQRLWWIMNDRGNVHEATGSSPIGLEVHASAFAFDFPTVAHMTFYQYKLINKNTKPLQKTYAGLYVDVDLGNFDDDYVGSDSLLHLGYGYNADNDDEGIHGYGINPPAIGLTFMESALANRDGYDNNRDGIIDEPEEKLGMTGFISHFWSGHPVSGAPALAMDYYNYLQAKWRDGSPMESFGFGRPENTGYPTTKFAHPGDPLTGEFWTELNSDSSGVSNEPFDRRFITATGPFNLAPNDTVEIRFAFVWSRGTNNLDSVAQLKKDVTSIRGANEAIYTPSDTRYVPAPESTFINHVLGFKQNYPNPFSQSTNLSYSLPQSMRVRLAVYDILGREVELLVDAQQDAGIYNMEFDAGNLPAGIYLARIELDHLRFTKQMVLLR